MINKNAAAPVKVTTAQAHCPYAVIRSRVAPQRCPLSSHGGKGRKNINTMQGKKKKNSRLYQNL